MTPRSLAPKPVRRVLVVAKIGPPEGPRMAAELTTWLQRRGISVSLDEETSEALGRKDGVPRGSAPRGTDLAIVAGGDGTLLAVARAVAPARIPILGVNFGGLGFLTELQPDELYQALGRVLRGDYVVEERQAFRVRYRSGRIVRSEHSVLNDAVITKSALARMITLAVRVDEDDVATYTSDGLILSTPTGSTAYNLSAGGPILDPRMKAFVIAPICPHAMAFRPLVVPGSVRVEVTLKSEQEAVYLTLDGQVGFPMRHGDSISADFRARPVRLVRVAGRSFFEVLRRKLRWGARSA